MKEFIFGLILGIFLGACFSSAWKIVLLIDDRSKYQPASSIVKCECFCPKLKSENPINKI
jgi:hypothetical protein